MNTLILLQHSRRLGTVAAAVGVVALTSLFASAVYADAPMITVAIHVNSRGLDLTQNADAQKFYRRLQDAAWEACTRANRVGLAPVDDPMRCTDQSLARAIRSVSVPSLTRIYLETHTLQQAAVAGITVPLAAATK